jgi:hypothetical protein
VAVILEKEAKEKWCPFTSVSAAPNIDSLTITNRGDRMTSQTSFAQDRELCRCVGKDCMAWLVSSERSGSCGLVR